MPKIYAFFVLVLFLKSQIFQDFIANGLKNKQYGMVCGYAYGCLWQSVIFLGFCA